MRLATRFDSPLPVPLSGKPFAAMGLEGGFTLRYKPPIGLGFVVTPEFKSFRGISSVATLPAVFHGLLSSDSTWIQL